MSEFAQGCLISFQMVAKIKGEWNDFLIWGKCYNETWQSADVKIMKIASRLFTNSVLATKNKAFDYWWWSCPCIASVLKWWDWSLDSSLIYKQNFKTEKYYKQSSSSPVSLELCGKGSWEKGEVKKVWWSDVNKMLWWILLLNSSRFYAVEKLGKFKPNLAFCQIQFFVKLTHMTVKVI